MDGDGFFLQHRDGVIHSVPVRHDLVASSIGTFINTTAVNKTIDGASAFRGRSSPVGRNRSGRVLFALRE